ncbi:ribonuclease T2 family protein [Qipengyuania aquimaris]|uniref:ribonuclease T2 family protein n=1 Tax=Qipengyuania aquimaris TaxID=255984 RepID=UPI001FD03AB8|nr:ribonuclease T [Qipengyuania aquimaris]UOR16093.1 ribonuclease T [Qipengyuania aquimaris]
MATRHLALGLSACAALASPHVAQAQAFQCSLPAQVEIPRIDTERPRRLPVTGYTLALSWSPEFCRFREDQRRHARQCSGDSGRFGFIVHGLWPDSERSWPQWCGGRQLRESDVRPNLCISPDARLLARQWAKHGSCMTRRPATYFKVTRILYGGLQWPDFVRISREDDLTVGTIRKRFADANPGWFPEAVGVVLDRRGWLEELRLCYDERFMPEACDRQRYGAQDGKAVKIWRGL